MRLVRLFSAVFLVVALTPAALPPTPVAADMPCCAGDDAPCSADSLDRPLMDCCRSQPASPATPSPRAAQPLSSSRTVVTTAFDMPPAPPPLPAVMHRPAPSGGILSRSLLSRHAVLLI